MADLWAFFPLLTRWGAYTPSPPPPCLVLPLPMFYTSGGQPFYHRRPRVVMSVAGRGLKKSSDVCRGQRYSKGTHNIYLFKFFAFGGLAQELLAGHMRPVGRRLPTPVLHTHTQLQVDITRASFVQQIDILCLFIGTYNVPHILNGLKYNQLHLCEDSHGLLHLKSALPLWKILERCTTEGV